MDRFVDCGEAAFNYHAGTSNASISIFTLRRLHFISSDPLFARHKVLFTCEVTTLCQQDFIAHREGT
jgi:hypothetical protein